MSSECLFNKLVKFHKMNVQIHSYRYCRVWNKKELGQMGLLKTPNVQTLLFPIPSHSDLSHYVMLQNECTIETGQWNYTYVTTGMTTIQIPFTAHSACVVSTISPATGNAEQRFKLRSFQGLDDYSSCNTLHILTFACIYFQIVT